MKKSIIIFSISVFLVSCFGSKKVAETPTVVNLEKAQAKFAGYTLESYTQGEKLYTANCQSCHGLKDPLAFSEDQWSALVPDMSAKSNKKKGTSITKEEEELMFKYLVSQGLIK